MKLTYDDKRHISRALSEIVAQQGNDDEAKRMTLDLKLRRNISEA